MSNGWVPIADAEIDEDKRYECTFKSGIVSVRQGDAVQACKPIAIRLYDPTPYVAPTPIDPGEGWRLLAWEEPKQAGDECRHVDSRNAWIPVDMSLEKHARYVYRRRIKPTYRPFANAEEYKPHRERWLRYKQSGSLLKITAYGDVTDFRYYFEKYEFEDGTPFGVAVTK